MVRYERTEVGRGLATFAIVLTLVVTITALIPVFLEVISGKMHPGILAVIGSILGLTSIFLPGMTRLFVRLSDESLELRMGVFSRKIDLSEVTGVSVVPVSKWAGWGLRYSVDGELWRVTGNRAVRLEFRHKKKGSSFSLAVNDPESLERAIKNLLERSPD